MYKDIRQQIKFGTDGWRAVIGDTFTFENVRIVTQAVCDYIHKELADTNKKVVVVIKKKKWSESFSLYGF
ncbi:MAG: hypothetical protein AABY43_05995 [Candidatus Omnitrophota bacterium]